MAKNVIIKQNEVHPEQLKYMEELKQKYKDARIAIQQEHNKILQYKELSKKLGDVHKKISYNILIPICEYPSKKMPLCFLPGQIVHTNEVFMPLGTTYYSKITNNEALTHCDKKIADIEDEIEEMEEENKKILGTLVFMEEATLQPGQVEIIEEYDENAPESSSRWKAPRQSHANKPAKCTENSSNLVATDFKNGVLRGG